MTNKFNGPHSWMAGNQESTKEAEELLTRCDSDYGQIFTRLTQSVSAMIQRGDGDALVLLSQFFSIGSQQIASVLTGKPIPVVKAGMQ